MTGSSRPLDLPARPRGKTVRRDRLPDEGPSDASRPGADSFRGPQFLHARQHLGYAFWMDDQESPYYRRHLLLHEYTHCFMLAERPAVGTGRTVVPGRDGGDSTHRLDRSGKLTFDIMPQLTEEVLGIGRIEMIEKAVRGDFHSVRQVRELGGEAFSQSRSDPYAWGWAPCHFLGNHPRYRERFRQLHVHRTDGQFGDVRVRLRGRRGSAGMDWEWFITDLTYGLELSNSGLTFAEGEPSRAPRTVKIDSRGSWQSTGVRLAEGVDRRLGGGTGDAQCATTRPWVSEPAGITIEYEGGVPIGCLVGWILPDAPEALGHPDRTAQVSRRILRSRDRRPVRDALSSDQ